MHRTSDPAVIVHGGAGDLPEARASAVGAARLDGVRRACAAGAELLRRGGPALDAVEAAVRILEDDPAFNAGTGAVLTLDGEVELDAAVMEGETLRCGAVAVVKDVQNAVSLARAVLERTEHVLLVGPAASALAREAGIAAVENASLVTPAQRERWEAARRGASASRTGTVGAVARDVRGHLAAATSTGGMSMKRPGRVGDTPLIGCGTYADDGLAAVSCTGHGERIVQLTLARHAADLVGAGKTAFEAAREAIRLLAERVQGVGGLIVVGPAGPVGFAHSTPAMARAWTAEDGRIVTAL
ncbi:MAG TPA: isoaspartyl peptidase/L-asparaginase [Anaeromyxobacter sp.]